MAFVPEAKQSLFLCYFEQFEWQVPGGKQVDRLGVRDYLESDLLIGTVTSRRARGCQRMRGSPLFSVE